MIAGVLLVIALAACSSETEAEQRTRCALCGMNVSATSRWRAGARAEDGATLAFDTPKCLFRYRDQRGPVRDAWVIEYYAQERRGVERLFYVLGSDVEGPMGRDLVPIEGRENAERFSRDHHGQRVLAYDEVTREVVGTLFARSH
jgi:nitrous oxide reductase accessory protein NosL